MLRVAMTLIHRISFVLLFEIRHLFLFDLFILHGIEVLHGEIYQLLLKLNRRVAFEDPLHLLLVQGLPLAFYLVLAGEEAKLVQDEVCRSRVVLEEKVMNISPDRSCLLEIDVFKRLKFRLLVFQAVLLELKVKLAALHFQLRMALTSVMDTAAFQVLVYEMRFIVQLFD